jgi:hypothetical protein
LIKAGEKKAHEAGSVTALPFAWPIGLAMYLAKTEPAQELIFITEMICITPWAIPGEQIP